MEYGLNEEDPEMTEKEIDNLLFNYIKEQTINCQLI